MAQQSAIPFEILHEDTYSVVKDLVEEGGTYCAPCSRPRRGVPYTAAERLGCNKLALGITATIRCTRCCLISHMPASCGVPAAYRTDDGRFGSSAAHRVRRKDSRPTPSTRFILSCPATCAVHRTGLRQTGGAGS